MPVCVGSSQPRRHTIGKGPGIELDLVAAAEAFVPTSKAVREAVPALHKLGPDSHVAVVNAAVTLAKVRRKNEPMCFAAETFNLLFASSLGYSSIAHQLHGFVG